MLLKLKGHLNLKDGEIMGIASTQSPDRDGEIIMQDGWDLSNFKSNPVILASHNYHDFPIGKATGIAVDGEQLTFKMVFSKATEEAKQAYELVKEGILNCFSVGFIPRAFDPNNQDVITNAELLEISLVSVPANPQAVVMAKSFKGNKLAETLIKEWLTDEKLALEVDKIEKGAVMDELQGEAAMEQKWEMLEDFWEVCYAFCDVYCDEKTSVNQFGTLLSETAGLLQRVANGEDLTGDDNTMQMSITPEKMKEFTKEKLIKLITASKDGNIEKIGEESGEVESKELDVKMIQKVTGHLQELLHDIKKGGAK
jgi:HK97 family phage prohead protease